MLKSRGDDLGVFKGEHKIKTALATVKSKSTQIIKSTATWLNQNKFNLIKTIGTTAAVATIFGTIVWWGNGYVKEHTNEVFHVYVGDEEVGTVSRPEVVEKYILDKVKQLESEYPNVNMLINSEEIAYEAEKAFMIEADDEQVIDRLDEMLTAVAFGVELRVDGRLIGIVKDQETADMILAQVQEQYIPPTEKKINDQVSILSFEEPSNTRGNSQIEEVGFVETVETGLIETKPNNIVSAEQILEKLIIGDTLPTKYIVEKGDCIICIAERFDISPRVIYDNNNLTEDSILNIGDELDLTVVEPILSVKTVERHVELQDVPFETIYEYDDKVRVGNDRVIVTGAPGKKLVTLLTTKVNGHWVEDEVVDEEVVVPPIAQVIRKGTLVVKGEGTGKFAHPLKGKIRITSQYGMRWGRLHAGIDFTSTNRDIFASDNGVVTIAGSHKSYGNYVVIDHKNGYKTLYAHLSKINTTKGKIVAKGDKIGVMGSTGNSTGIHLHFEIHKNGKKVNPYSYLYK